MLPNWISWKNKYNRFKESSYTDITVLQFFTEFSRKIAPVPVYYLNSAGRNFVNLKFQRKTWEIVNVASKKRGIIGQPASFKSILPKFEIKLSQRAGIFEKRTQPFFIFPFAPAPSASRMQRNPRAPVNNIISPESKKSPQHPRFIANYRAIAG